VRVNAVVIFSAASAEIVLSGQHVDVFWPLFAYHDTSYDVSFLLFAFILQLMVTLMILLHSWPIVCSIIL